VKRALLHGFLGDPSVWADIVDGAAIALPGHGSPIASTWEQNLDAIAAQIGDCDLAIGYSLGARVALGLLAIGAVRRAILISVNPGIDDGDRTARRASDAAWAKRFRTEALSDILDAWEAQPLFATQSRVSRDVLRARRARRLALDPEQIARSLESMGLAEMPDYKSLVTPDRCTLIAGADDAKYLAIARSLNVPLHVIDHCGHDPLLEQPARLAEALARVKHE
jgi:2-succinyl-6-hydroxy-2,4-cyclohexadiene-1-carboxylate synthase